MVTAANARLSPQHQQAMQAQVRAMQAAQQAQAQAQVQALAQGQPQAQASHLSPTLSYTNRASSSPSMSQASPAPHAQTVTDGSTTNGSSNGTPRPPSTQPAHPGHNQIPTNVARAAMPYYANMNMVGGQQFTQEQMEQAMRLQSILQVSFLCAIVSLGADAFLTQQRGSQMSPGAQQGQQQMSPPPGQVQMPPAQGSGGYPTQ
jgi:hypothetical protein